MLTNTAPPDVRLAAQLRLAVVRLARQLRRHSVGGLTPSQLSALASVSKLGPVRLGDLAAREGVAPPTLTRIVAALEDKALVERNTDPIDGRCSLIGLSSEGSDTLDSIRSEATALLATRLRSFTPDQRAQLAAALPLLEGLIEDRSPPPGTSP
ncbi:MAG: MarR family winged helix-turn-helix transcriptional regulator [Acidimicrobiales bacterium]